MQQESFAERFEERLFWLQSFVRGVARLGGPLVETSPSDRHEALIDAMTRAAVSIDLIIFEMVCIVNESRDANPGV